MKIITRNKFEINEVDGVHVLTNKEVNEISGGVSPTVIDGMIRVTDFMPRRPCIPRIIWPIFHPICLPARVFLGRAY